MIEGYELYGNPESPPDGPIGSAPGRIRIWYDVNPVESPQLTTHIDCGTNSIIATGLSLECLVALEWLLRFPQHCPWWPFPIKREIFDILHIKLFGDYKWQ